jgi:Sporulation and spore germination
VVSAAAASVAVVALVVVTADRGPSPSPKPTQVNPVAPTRVATAPAAPALPVYYLGQVGTGYRLFREFHPMPTTGPPSSTSDRVQQAVTQALSRRPDDPDYHTLWPAGAGARTTLTPDLISIQLNEAAAGGLSVPGTAADAIAIQQLIWTATAAAAPGGSTGPLLVLLRADGPTPDRLGSINLARPFRRGSSPGTGDPRAPVWIDSLGQDSAVAAGLVTVRGESVGVAAGGPSLTWSVTRSGSSGQLRSGELQATSPAGGRTGVGVRGNWTLSLDLSTPGRYTLTVSQGDSIDSKEFVLVPR